MEEKENKTPKTKQKKNPHSEGGEEQTELWTKVTPDSEDTLQPAPRGRKHESGSCCSAHGNCRLPPDSNSLAFSVLFIFFSFLLFNTQTLNFQSLKKFT